MYPSLVQEGSYSYESPDGTLIQTRYIANENGFQVFGDHLPTPPPVSEEIQKGLDLIYEGIRLQKVRFSLFLGIMQRVGKTDWPVITNTI